MFVSEESERERVSVQSDKHECYTVKLGVRKVCGPRRDTHVSTGTNLIVGE